MSAHRAARRSLARQTVDALSTAHRVRQRCGKPVLAQLLEIAALSRLPNRILPDEYFAMRLFDDARLDWRAKTAFLGKRAKPHVYRINDPSWRALADDKLACLAQLAAFDLPIPRTVAVHARARRHPGALVLATQPEVADFLRNRAPYPLFSKPNAGALGRQGVALASYDRSVDQLVLGNGERLPVSAYLESTIARSPGGIIFQELVAPHATIRDVCGDRLATVRVLLLNGPDGQVLHRAALRIPAGLNMVDNFRHGELGNLVASLDPEDGRIRRVIAGTGLDMREVDRHPDTHQPFANLRLPGWDHLADICRTAGHVMDGLRIQGWDIALSDRGPLLMEVNFYGDFDLFQFADGRGVADDTWRRATGAPPH